MSVNKLFLGVQRINVNNICVAPDKDLCLGNTTVGSRCVRVQSVSGHRLPAMHDIEHRIRGLISLFKQYTGG